MQEIIGWAVESLGRGGSGVGCTGREVGGGG